VETLEFLNVNKEQKIASYSAVISSWVNLGALKMQDMKLQDMQRQSRQEAQLLLGDRATRKHAKDS